MNLAGLAGLGAIVGGADEYQRRQQQQLYQRFLMQAEQQRLAQQAQQLQLQNQEFQQGQQGLGAAWSAAGQLGGGGSGQPQPSPQMNAPDTMYRPMPPADTSRLKSAILQLESGNRDYPPDSRTGAVGPGQIMPRTAAGYGVGGAALRDPTQNRQLSGRIIDDLSSKYGGNPQAVAVGYNAGPGMADKFLAGGGNPSMLPKETQGYLQKLAPLIGEAKQTSQAVTQAVPQQQWGRSSIEQLHQAIEQANPGASPQVKMLALMQLQKLMAPTEKAELQAWAQQHREVFQQEMMQQRQSFQEDMMRQRQSFQEQMAQQRQGGGAQKLGKPQFLELTNPDGTKKQVYVQERGPGDWVDAATGQKVDIPPGTDIGAVKAPGRQAAAQVNAMINAGNETAGALNNLVDLPISATAGWLMGVQAEKPAFMGEALKRSLASNMTPDDAKAVQVSFQGVARAMATLEAAGRATGLVGLTQQAQILMPQQGDSGLTVLRKYGEIRQLAERSIETIQASPDVGSDQKKLLSGIVDQIKKSVPWTVKDVNALQRNPTDATVQQFAQRVHAEGAAEGQGGGYSVGQVIEKGGKKYRVTGGDPSDPDVEEVK